MLPSIESTMKRMYITFWKVLLVTLRAFGMMPVGTEFLPDKIVIKRSRTWEAVSAALIGTLIVLFPFIIYNSFYDHDVNFLRKTVWWSIVLKSYLFSTAAVALNVRRQRVVDVARYFLVYYSVHPLRTNHLKLLLVLVAQVLFFFAQCALSTFVYYTDRPPFLFSALLCLAGRIFLDAISCSVFSLTDSLFCNQVVLLRQFILDLNVDLEEVASSLETPTAHQTPPWNDLGGLPKRDATRRPAKPTLVFVAPTSVQESYLPPTDTEAKRHTPIEILQVDLSAAPSCRPGGASGVACGRDIGHRPETWRRLRLRQAYLHSLFKALNREYTWPNLCSVIMAFVETTVALYYAVAAKEGDAWKGPSYVWGFAQYARLSAVALICQLTTDQVTTTSNLLNKVLSIHCLGVEAREEVRAFSLQNTVLEVRFRVGDYIALDFSMIVTITGAVSTYLVILVQEYPSEITTQRV